ncbi:hypothetical protein SAMN05216266_102244 [Amycolatopsis marina]|uniref:Uncharacterized protein n=1 Tax=Amycolatopsis marina TaxID=490629 RepID=A0A1I0WWY5_9PSEU|nr:hypothetical protein [Amycolatopsis marina]SFA92680.1 hypothetical protein SAMN05216266_102244 [Amycolatopsis marina]
MPELLAKAEELDASPGLLRNSAEAATPAVIITGITEITTGVTIGMIVPPSSTIAARAPRDAHVDALVAVRSRALG